MTEQSQELIDQLLSLMAEHRTDFTLTFRHLTDLVAQLCENEEYQAVPYTLPGEFTLWLEQWTKLLNNQSLSLEKAYSTMCTVNPAFIPRNHLIEEVIVAAENNNFQLFNDLINVLETPFHYSAEKESYVHLPEEDQRVEHTFCGT